MNYMRFIYACSLFLGLILPASQLQGMMQLVNPLSNNLDEVDAASPAEEIVAAFSQKSVTDDLNKHLGANINNKAGLKAILAATQKQNERIAKHLQSLEQEKQVERKRKSGVEVASAPASLGLEEGVVEEELQPFKERYDNLISRVDEGIREFNSVIDFGIGRKKESFFDEIHKELDDLGMKIAMGRNWQTLASRALSSEIRHQKLRLQELQSVAKKTRGILEYLSDIDRLAPSENVLKMFHKANLLSYRELPCSCGITADREPCSTHAEYEGVSEFIRHNVGTIATRIAELRSPMQEIVAEELKQRAAREKEFVEKFRADQLKSTLEKMAVTNWSELNKLSLWRKLGAGIAAVAAAALLVKGGFWLKAKLLAQSA